MREWLGVIGVPLTLLEKSKRLQRRLEDLNKTEPIDWEDAYVYSDVDYVNIFICLNNGIPEVTFSYGKDHEISRDIPDLAFLVRKERPILYMVSKELWDTFVAETEDFEKFQKQWFYWKDRTKIDNDSPFNEKPEVNLATVSNVLYYCVEDFFMYLRYDDENIARDNLYSPKEYLDEIYEVLDIIETIIEEKLSDENREEGLR